MSDSQEPEVLRPPVEPDWIAKELAAAIEWLRNSGAVITREEQVQAISAWATVKAAEVTSQQKAS